MAASQPIIPLRSRAFTRQKLCVDFAGLKHACPKGVYVAPVPDEPLLWTGTLFVRKGPYSNAILRFHIDFPVEYPEHPPIITFDSDVFHPLLTPLTTYTYTTRDKGGDTVSAADEEKLPPGGLSLRHGFPEWFQDEDEAVLEQRSSRGNAQGAVRGMPAQWRPPRVAEVLQYLRLIFDTEGVLDSIPLEAAANTGAWHAWRSHRSKSSEAVVRASAARASGETSSEGGTSLRQQPGGARRPGEWNWQGVWEDRVRKSVQASLSEPVLYGGESSDVIGFAKVNDEVLASISPLKHVQLQTAT